jgi:hypothetical protein
MAVDNFDAEGHSTNDHYEKTNITNFGPYVINI